MTRFRAAPQNARDLGAVALRQLGGLVNVLIATVLIVFGGIHIVAGFFPDLIEADWMLPEIVRRALSVANDADPGDQGDYYNFLIGVPLAAAGSAVAAVVAASARSVANRQRAIQEMNLVDRKITDKSQSFLRLVNAFDDIYDEGQRLHDDLERCYDECVALNVDFMAILNEERESVTGRLTEGADYERLKAKWQGRLAAPVETIQDKAVDIFNGFQELAFDPFWSFAIDLQTEVIQKNWDRPLVHLREAANAVPDIEDSPAKDQSPRAVARDLRRWTEKTNLELARLAYGYTPDGVTPIEFVGAMIRLIDDTGNHPDHTFTERAKAGRHDPIDIYNKGAAALFALYRALPSQEALRRTVFSLFPSLDGLETRGYFASLPDKRSVTNDRFEEAYDGAYKDPDLLIYRQPTGPDEINQFPVPLSKLGDKSVRRVVNKLRVPRFGERRSADAARKLPPPRRAARLSVVSNG